jgi:hypothetical protein
LLRGLLGNELGRQFVVEKIKRAGHGTINSRPFERLVRLPSRLRPD